MTAVRTRNVVEQRFTLVYGNVARHLAADSEAQLRARAVLVAALEDPATGAAQAEALKP